MGGKPALVRGDAKQLFSGSDAAKPKTACLSGQNIHVKLCRIAKQPETTLVTISDGIFGGSGLHPLL